MNYVIYDINNVANIDFSKTVLKFEGETPSFLVGLQQYTHSEILGIMRTSEWNNQE